MRTGSPVVISLPAFSRTRRGSWLGRIGIQSRPWVIWDDLQSDLVSSVWCRSRVRRPAAGRVFFGHDQAHPVRTPGQDPAARLEPPPAPSRTSVRPRRTVLSARSPPAVRASVSFDTVGSEAPT